MPSPCSSLQHGRESSLIEIYIKQPAPLRAQKGVTEMFARCLAVLGLLFLALTFTSPVIAGGLPMMYEIKGTPEQKLKVLSNLIEEALEKERVSNKTRGFDPYTPLRGIEVIKGSECTTPSDFLAAIQAYHQGAVGLTSVEELPAYIRSLQWRPQSEGVEYRMSRILHTKAGGQESCTLDLAGWTRSLRPDEGGYYDPSLNRLILAPDCTNVVGLPVAVPLSPAKPVMAAPPPPQTKPRVVSPPAVAYVPKEGECALPYRGVLIFVWDYADLPQDLQAEVDRVVAIEDSRDDSFEGSSVSRTLGDAIYTRVANTAPVVFNVEATLAPTEDVVITGSEYPLGTVHVEGGMGHVSVPAVELQNEAVRFIIPRSELKRLEVEGWKMLSPTLFGALNERELRLLYEEWEGQCSKKVHIVLKRLNIKVK